MEKVHRALFYIVVVVGLAACAVGASAQEQSEPKEGPPLPLHTIEGVGGLVLTPTAYLVNPQFELDLSKPAVSVQNVWVGDRDMQVLAATWAPSERVELGYAVNRLDLRDFASDVAKATPFTVSTGEVYLHHFNLRVQLINEKECDEAWMPTVTAGVHYKYNSDINDIDREMGGTLIGLGYDDDSDGVDLTLTASKTVTCAGRPTILSAGVRASRAAQFGLTGFGDEYLVSFEGGAVMLVTDQLALGAEVRQKRDQYADIPGIVEGEDTWWDVHAAYILNNNAEVYAVVGDAGAVLNHTDETFWGLVFKYEF